MSSILTAGEAAKRLGVTQRTIARWIKKGRFPNAYKLDPTERTSPYRIPVTDIVAFEETRRTSIAVTG